MKHHRFGDRVYSWLHPATDSSRLENFVPRKQATRLHLPNLAGTVARPSELASLVGEASRPFFIIVQRGRTVL